MYQYRCAKLPAQEKATAGFTFVSGLTEKSSSLRDSFLTDMGFHRNEEEV